MQRNRPEDTRDVEHLGGNRDALIEGNIVADERQLDPNADVRASTTGSDRMMRGGDQDGFGDPSGAYGSNRTDAADDTLKDGSIPADADLDMPSDAMNDPEQLDDRRD